MSTATTQQTRSESGKQHRCRCGAYWLLLSTNTAPGHMLMTPDTASTPQPSASKTLAVTTPAGDYPTGDVELTGMSIPEKIL